MAEDQVFLGRARQLALARDLIAGDEEYAAASALLSVHVAIALNDALLLNLAGRRPRGQNHAKAAQDIEKICRFKKYDQSGLKHLRTLLAKKTMVSYSDEATSPALAAALNVASQRFQEWAYSILILLRRTT